MGDCVLPGLKKKKKKETGFTVMHHGLVLLLDRFLGRKLDVSQPPSLRSISMSDKCCQAHMHVLTF